MARKPKVEERTTAKDVANALRTASVVMLREDSQDIDPSKLETKYLPAVEALLDSFHQFTEQEHLTLAEAAWICVATANRLYQARVEFNA